MHEALYPLGAICLRITLLLKHQNDELVAVGVQELPDFVEHGVQVLVVYRATAMIHEDLIIRIIRDQSAEPDSKIQDPHTRIELFREIFPLRPGKR